MGRARLAGGGSTPQMSQTWLLLPTLQCNGTEIVVCIGMVGVNLQNNSIQLRRFFDSPRFVKGDGRSHDIHDGGRSHYRSFFLGAPLTPIRQGYP